MMKPGTILRFGDIQSLLWLVTTDGVKILDPVSGITLPSAHSPSTLAVEAAIGNVTVLVAPIDNALSE